MLILTISQTVVVLTGYILRSEEIFAKSFVIVIVCIQPAQDKKDDVWLFLKLYAALFGFLRVFSRQTWTICIFPNEALALKLEEQIFVKYSDSRQITAR